MCPRGLRCHEVIAGVQPRVAATTEEWHHAGVKKAATAIRPPKKQPVTKKKVAAVKAVVKKVGPRADLGAPIDGFFGRQPAHLRAILGDLRKLVEEAAPDATSSLKWGMPFYTVGGHMMCALAAFKGHVNLILSGPPDTFADPDGFLEGDGKTGRHLKLRSREDLPRAEVRGWLRSAAVLARKQK
jgi:hypothetical protein